MGASGGSVSGLLTDGQAVAANLSTATAAALYAQPGVSVVNILFEPNPSLPNDSALHLGGGVAQAVGAPFDLKLQLADSAGKALAPSAAGSVDLTLPVYSVSGGTFAWLQGSYDASGGFLGYIRPAADFDAASNTVTLHPAATALSGTLFLPVVISPAYVQNFDAGVHLFSGPDARAVDFGVAGVTQFTTFTVVAPQLGQRLYVYNPNSGNYGWIDVAGVGPSGAPGRA